MAKCYAPNLARIVLTGSLASIVDYKLGTKPVPQKVYTSQDWTPVSWEKACRTEDFFTLLSASKLFPEKTAIKWIEENQPNFSIVSLLPAVVFGPFIHLNTLEDVHSTPLMTLEVLHTNKIAALQKLANSPTLFPLAIDVRDVATAHVKSLSIDLDCRRYHRYILASGNYDNHLMVATLHHAKLLAPEINALTSEELQQANIDRSPISNRNYYSFNDLETRRDLHITFRTFQESIQDMFIQFQSTGNMKQV